MNFDLNNH